MGKENGTNPWFRYDDVRAELGLADIGPLVKEAVTARLAEKDFPIGLLQEVLAKEYDLPIAIPALRKHVNQLIEAGEVTITLNGGGNGGPRIYHSESVLSAQTLTDEEFMKIVSAEAAEKVFEECRGRSYDTIGARYIWDADL